MSISSRSGSSAASVRSFASTNPSVTTTDQDADVPPSYTSLFPNQTTSTTPDTANLMRDRRDIPRYTTITLREIRFPSGCPCHPKNPSAGREALRQERIALARAACDRPQHSPPSIVPVPEDTEPGTPATNIRSRLTTRERTTSSSSASSTRTTHPTTTTASQCATSLSLEVIAIGQHQRGHEPPHPSAHRGKANHDSSTPVAYRTTALKWWECMVTLPPKFVLLSGDKPVSEGGRDDQKHEVSVAVAKISRPPFMNLPPGNRAWIEMAEAGWSAERQRSLPCGSETEKMERCDSDGPARTGTRITPSLSEVKDWEIRQEGFRRVYNFYPVTKSAPAAAAAAAATPSSPAAQKLSTGTTKGKGQDDDYGKDGASSDTETDTVPAAGSEHTFTWKGSRSILASLPSSAAEDDDVEAEGEGEGKGENLPVCHGNLKLVDSQGRVLAAWRQQRGKRVLGRLYVFEGDEEDGQEGKGKGRGRLHLDVVVATCLYVVVVERILWTTFVGG